MPSKKKQRRAEFLESASSTTSIIKHFQGEECFKQLYTSEVSSPSFSEIIPLTNAASLSLAIDKKTSTLSKFKKKTAIYALLKNPFFFSKIKHRFLKHKQIEEKIRAEADSYGLSLNYEDKHKATVVIDTAQVLTLMLGYSLPKPPLLYQVALLYPITDNLLDDKLIGQKDKLEFCNAIKTFILNSVKNGENDLLSEPDYQQHLSINCRKILSAINVKSKAFKTPKVWKALLELNCLQQESVFQQTENAREASLQELFDLSFRKGALTFKLIILLMLPNVSSQDLKLCEVFGGIAQLLDDIEDIEEDLEAGLVSFALAFTLGNKLQPPLSETKPPAILTDVINFKQALNTPAFSEKFNTYMSLICHYLNQVMRDFHKHRPFISKKASENIYTKLLRQIKELVNKNDIKVVTTESTPPAKIKHCQDENERYNSFILIR